MRLNGDAAYSHYAQDELVLEIRPGNTCNLACQTCWPQASSRVTDYYRKAKKTIDIQLLMNLGICLLHNLGNNCYMNTIFQILLHTPELINIVTTAKPHRLSNTRDEYDILYYWKDIVRTAYSSPMITSIYPRSLVQCIRKLSSKRTSMGFDTNHQDASELLVFLMDVFHIALSRPVNFTMNVKNNVTDSNIECYNRIKQLYSNGYSDIIQSFYGMSITEIIDQYTGTVVSKTFDPYFTLNISIPKGINNPTIYDCLDTLFAREVLDPNTWINEETRCYQDVIKHTRLWSIPNVLILNMKIYPTTFTGRDIITIPHVINLCKYLHSTITPGPTYRLYGVCNHIGTMTHGHYYAYVYIEGIQSWIELNDNQIPKKIKSDEVITSNAVCMFYRKC
jgi:ubiquitin C-terminal hydrolase